MPVELTPMKLDEPSSEETRRTEDTELPTPTQVFVRVHDVDDNNDRDDEPNPVWQRELRAQTALAFPMIVTFVLESIPGIICIILVGQIKDGKARHYVDAATLSNMFTILTCFSIAFGMTSALDTLCSQAYGANCRKKIGIYLQSGFIVIGICIIPMFILNWYTEQILVLFGQNREIAKLAGEFSRITVFGMPFLLLYELLRKCLQAQQIVRPMVVIAVISVGIDVVGGYLLTYHTSLGFHGAALSRTLAYAAMPLCMAVYFMWTKSYKSWWSGWNMREARRQTMEFLRLGVPGMLMSAMQWWGFELLAFMAGLLPDPVTTVSTHAVIANLGNLTYMTCAGISASANIRVGNALGANKPKHARLTCNLSLSVVSIWTAFLAVLVIILRYQLPLIFVHDETVVHQAAIALLVFAPYTMVDGANTVLQGIFRGFGHQRVAAWSNAIGTYGVAIPVGVVAAFVLHGGVPSLWGSLLLGYASAMLVLAVRLRKSDWKALVAEAQARTAL